MKTKITSHERAILMAAFDILSRLDERLWAEYFCDKKNDGSLKFHGKAHKAARTTSALLIKLYNLLGLFNS